MRPAVIDVRNAEDGRDVVHRAVQALAEGRLVVFPTETVYGLAASALNEQAVARLLKVKGRAPGHPMTLAIKGLDDALDYVPNLSLVGRRLARRCWPGPVTLVLKDGHPQSLLRQLPELTRQAVSPDGSVGLRVPAHQLISDVCHLVAGPLVLTSANRTGEPDALSASDVVERLQGDVDMVLDDGPSKLGQPSSVIQVRGNRVKVLRTGVVSEANLNRLASYLVVLVCTGNTCRSPMAEAMLRRRASERLGCKPDELEDRGVLVMSAGIAAMEGSRPAAEAVEIMKERGLDLSTHQSQPLTDRLVSYADMILTMTQNHREAILTQWPAAHDRVAVLSRDQADIADPFGASVEVYRFCADQIDAALASYVEKWDWDNLLKVDDD